MSKLPDTVLDSGGDESSSRTAARKPSTDSAADNSSSYKPWTVWTPDDSSSYNPSTNTAAVTSLETGGANRMDGLGRVKTRRRQFEKSPFRCRTPGVHYIVHIDLLLCHARHDIASGSKRRATILGDDDFEWLFIYFDNLLQIAWALLGFCLALLDWMFALLRPIYCRPSPGLARLQVRLNHTYRP